MKRIDKKQILLTLGSLVILTGLTTFTLVNSPDKDEGVKTQCH